MEANWKNNVQISWAEHPTLFLAQEIYSADKILLMMPPNSLCREWPTLRYLRLEFYNWYLITVDYKVCLLKTMLQCRSQLYKQHMPVECLRCIWEKTLGLDALLGLADLRESHSVVAKQLLAIHVMMIQQQELQFQILSLWMFYCEI